MNILLKLYYVLFESNVADRPSRFHSDADCSLSVHVWSLVEATFGPHTVDLMALPSNVMKDKIGRPLRFFSKYPISGSSGGDIFAQLLMPAENYCVPTLRFDRTTYKIFSVLGYSCYCDCS